MKSNSSDQRGFGIVVSGGPAPGINSVISAAVIEARNCGYRVKGFLDGFRGASSGDPSAVQDLTIEKISQIYNTGGSILGTSRFNPFHEQSSKDAFARTLELNEIDKLIVIGGDGSAYLSYLIGRQLPHVRVVHVPKTIDNDLVLPHQYPSFGFETARSAGTLLLDTLVVDARTTKRWFLVTSMGRQAGFLALGLGIAAGATLTLIPEEFESREITPDAIADIIADSIEKRKAMGRPYGLVVMAEGLLDCLDPESHEQLKNCPRDELGRLRYSHIELGDVLVPSLKKKISERRLSSALVAKNIGYELRCHAPISFDIEYTRFLGYAAVKLLCEGSGDIMVVRDYDKIASIPLSEMLLETKRMRSRKVDLNSDLYQVARRFMIR